MLDIPIDSMTLYSLDASFTPGLDKPFKGETFYEYPALGKTDIASPDDRREVLAAILKGIKESNGERAFCFWPHHGVRLMQNGKRIEYLICYHCFQAYKFEDGKSTLQLTTRSPAKVLDAYLQKAGVPRQKDEE